MTTTTIDTTGIPVETDTGAAPAVDIDETVTAEALYLPPATLVVEENVRKSFDLDDFPEITASIRRGVEIPILAHRESDGTITVVDGSLSNSVLLPVCVAGAAKRGQRSGKVKDTGRQRYWS